MAMETLTNSPETVLSQEHEAGPNGHETSHPRPGNGQDLVKPRVMNLLSDAPAKTVDKNGPHWKISEAIVGLILSHNYGADGGFSVGLEGRWGSGKTTVAKLVMDKLVGAEAAERSGKKFLAFAFDAWAHEGDPLRRTFLESLIRHLQGQGWLEKKEQAEEDEWENKLAELSHKREAKVITNTPEFKQLEKWAIASFFLIPLGTAVLSGLLKKDVVWVGWDLQRLDILLSLGIFVSSVFAVGPLILLLVVMVNDWLKERRAERKETDGGQTSSGGTANVAGGQQQAKATGKGSGEGKRSSAISKVLLWPLLSNKITTTSTTETLKTPNPTSIEFETTFRDLMEEVLKEPDKHLLLILDNLDRVAPDDALAIWSTLQTFLRSSSYDEPTAPPGDRGQAPTHWSKKITVLVLYDPDGIRKLWEGDSRQPELTTSFLDKSFQIRFEVPSPVRSDWHNFLQEILAQAFGGKGAAGGPDYEQQFHRVYRVISSFAAKRGIVPTIRELKLYVNQIGSFHRQWKDEIPLSHIAFHVMLRRFGIDPLKEIKEEKTWHERQPEYLDDWMYELLGEDEVEIKPAGKLQDGSQSHGGGADDKPEYAQQSKESIEAVAQARRRDVQRSLIALAFNVEKAKAYQLVLNDPINNFLLQKNGDGLKELHKQHTHGFWEVLDGAVQKLVTDRIDGRNNIAKISFCLDGSGLLNAEQSQDTSVGSGTFKRDIIDRLVKYAPDVEWNLCDDEKRDGLSALCRLIQQNTADKRTAEGILQKVTRDAVNGAAADGVAGWVTAVNKLHRASPPVWTGEVYKSVVKTADELLAPRTWREGFLALNDNSLCAVLEILNEIGSKLFTPCFDDERRGKVFKNLEQHRPRSPLTVAWCLLSIFRQDHMWKQDGRILALTEEVSGRGSGDLVEESRRGEVVREFVRLLARFMEKGDLLGNLFKIYETIGDASTPFVAACLREVLAGDHARVLFTPENLLKHWSLIRDEVAPPKRPTPAAGAGGAQAEPADGTDKLDELIARLVAEENFVGRICESHKSFDAAYANLYERVVSHDGLSIVQFKDGCISLLDRLSEEEWLKQITCKDDVVWLALALHRELKGEGGVSPGDAFNMALLNHIEKLVKGNDCYPDSYKSLPEMVPEPKQTWFRNKVYTIVEVEEAPPPPCFFRLYAGVLNQAGNFWKPSTRRFVIQHIFKRVVVRRDPDGLAWMRDLLDDERSLGHFRGDANSFHELKKRLAEEADSEEGGVDEAAAVIRNLTEILGRE